VVAIIEDDSFIILQKLTRASRGPDSSGAKAPVILVLSFGTIKLVPFLVLLKADG
jgi:hypothetical protein